MHSTEMSCNLAEVNDLKTLRRKKTQIYLCFWPTSSIQVDRLLYEEEKIEKYINFS